MRRSRSGVRILGTALATVLCLAVAPAVAQTPEPLPEEPGLGPVTGTINIVDDATGGECTSVGAWDPATKTCTLTTDIFETVALGSSGVTLDCANHGITRVDPAEYYGVISATGVSGVTVRDCQVAEFPMAIGVRDHSLVTNNTVTSTGWTRIAVLGQGTEIAGNTVTRGYISVLAGSQDIEIRDNSVAEAGMGIVGSYASGLLVERNHVGLPGQPVQQQLQFIYIADSVFRDNLLEAGMWGVILDASTSVAFTSNTVDTEIGFALGELYVGDSTDIEISRNTIPPRDPNAPLWDMLRIYQDPSTIRVFGNDFLRRSPYSGPILDVPPMELSFGGQGNHWGLTCTLGEPVGDLFGNWHDPDAVDSFPYGRPVAALDPLPAPPACLAPPPPPDPVELIWELIDEVIGVNLSQGISNSLDVKLDAALRALTDVNENNDVAAVNTLEAFINEVEAQSGQMIPQQDAAHLSALANEIIDLLSPSP